MRSLVLVALVEACAALINPILPGWNPDPSILRVGRDYFIATSSFEYFPGVPIHHSTDLVHWRLLGHVLNRPSQLALFGTPSDAGVWAPTLRYHDATFYLATTTRYVYTCDLSGLVAELRLFPRSFYVKTDDIFSNQWSDPVYFDFLGYDPDLFWDANGDVYVTWSGINNNVDKLYSIWQSKVNLSTGAALSPALSIFNGTLPHNSSARPEGPHLYHLNDTYYLLIAEGGTGPQHRATIHRGPTPSGPWESSPRNPVLYNGADLANAVQDTGHADIVQAPDGAWWGVALGVRPQRGNFSHVQLGRETLLFPVSWEDEWPVFNGALPVAEHLPGVLSDASPIAPYVNEFTSSTLDGSFYTIRTPYKPFHVLTLRGGARVLRLLGNAYAPGDRDTPALLLRKQTSYAETFETRLLGFKPRPRSPDADKTGAGTSGAGMEEAGACVFYGDALHDEIGVVGAVGDVSDGSGDPAAAAAERYVVVRTAVQAQQIGPWPLTPANATVTRQVFVPLQTRDAPVRLVVRANETSYALGYMEEGVDAEVRVVAVVDAAAISVPPAGGFFFKGAAFGIYNTGNGKPSLTPADFDCWKQVPQPLVS